MNSRNLKLISAGVLLLLAGVFIGNYAKVRNSGQIPAVQSQGEPAPPTRISGASVKATKADLEAVTEAIKKFQANMTTLPAPPGISRELVGKFIADEKESAEAWATAGFYLEDPSVLREGIKRHPDDGNLMTLLLLMDYKNMTPEEIGQFKKLNPNSSLPGLMGAVDSLRGKDTASALQSLLTVDASKIDLQCLALISSGEKKLYQQAGGLDGQDAPFAMRAASHVDIAERLMGSLGTLETAVKKLQDTDPDKASAVLVNLASTALALTRQPLDLSQSHTALRLENWAYRNMDPGDASLKNHFSEDLPTLLRQNDAELKQLNALWSLKSQIHLRGNTADIEKYAALSAGQGDLAALQTLMGDAEFFQYLVAPRNP